MKAKPVSEKGLKWFQDVRFGMFIHWGLYSLLARGEWVMHNERVPVQEYEKLADQFNPIDFNAKEWISLVADAGQKYIVVTSRHHDGFSMYDTELSDYKITNTAFKRDPLEELANECAKRNDIKLGFYSSLLDWHHPAYRFREESGLVWADYIGFLHGQVKELCTNFGEIACMWFDGDWPQSLMDESNAYFQSGGSFEYNELYSMIHNLQPDAVIHNNRHDEPLPGEDIQGFEQDLPGENTVGFNTAKVFDLPIEVCMTINRSWGVNSTDRDHKSTRQLVHNLVKSASQGGNYLLNVGPTAKGRILPVHAKRLREVGSWLAVYGESVYGTRKGVIPVQGHAVSTTKDSTHYVHILDYASDCVVLEGVPETVTKATLLRDGSSVQMNRVDGKKLKLTIPAEMRNVVDTVVKLD
ncbi:MAG: alpha-L-fucosidase [Anaerolineaceae bacterium]|nr:alpha-L-fucosidase [Anaerolineaceae bacterium]